MLAFSIAGVAPASQPNATSPDTPEILDEVIVEGMRLQELRAAVIDAEDRMLVRYNELNQDDDFDIECFRRTNTGSRISYRYCQTKLQARAQQHDASEFLTYMRNSDMQTGAAPPMQEVSVWLAARHPEYQRNLRKLVEKDPELRELVMRRAEVLRRYEALRPSARKERQER